jgi:quercetin dioxygenase-like cupin family protein
MFFKNNPVFIIVLYLTLIKIKLNMEQSFKKGVVLNLASLVEYSEGGVISKQLIKSPVGNVTLFSFDKGEGLSEHRAPFDAIVQVLEGVVNIVLDGKVFTLKAGESIVFPANAPHALTAVEKFKMLLTMIKG